MAKLHEIKDDQHEFMTLDGIPWFSEAANNKGLARGGVYLLSGPPGGGKTTLALQIAVDLANNGNKILYLSLEQSPSDIKQKILKQLFPDRHKAQPEEKKTYDWKEGLEKIEKTQTATQTAEKEEDRIQDNFFVDGSISSMEALPDFLARKVLGAGRYEGINLIVVDSIQGLGTAPTSSKPYQKLFEFNRWAKEQQITVLLIGHITKGGAIAGPRSVQIFIWS